MQNTHHAIDDFFSQLHLLTVLDHYCHLRGDFSLPHPALPQGQAYFHLILAGSCQLRIDTKDYVLQSGDFLLLSTGSAHQIMRGEGNGAALITEKQHIASKKNHPFALSSGADLEMMCGYFHSPHSAATQIMQQLPSVLHVALQDHFAIDALYRLIQNEACQASAGSSSIIRNLCEILLILALRHAHLEQSAALGIFSDPIASKIISLIQQDYSKAYSIEMLADYSHLSPSTLARRLKKATGMSVQQFIRLLKMNHAAQLLRHTSLPINHIIGACGYQSEAAFHNNFRRQFFCSALQFRRQNH